MNEGQFTAILEQFRRIIGILERIEKNGAPPKNEHQDIKINSLSELKDINQTVKRRIKRS